MKGINGAREHILWRQGASAEEEFIGALEDARGTHLFSFKVNGSSAVIKAMSSGYIVNLGGNNASIGVAHGAELGIVESSAYPVQLIDDPSDDKENAVLTIKGAAYSGERGVLMARRGSVWNSASSTNLSYTSAPEIKQHNGKNYNFFAQKGHGIMAHKDIVLEGQKINASRGILNAGKSIHFEMDRVAGKGQFKTHGSLIQAGDEIILTGQDWEGNTEGVFAGSAGNVCDVQIPADLVPNSPQALLDYGRALRYSLGRIEFSSEEERTTLARGPHAYGSYQSFSSSAPRWKPVYILVEAAYKNDGYGSGGYGGGFGGFGNYGGGGGFGHTVGSSSWAPPSSSFRQATVARQEKFIQQCGGGGNSFSMAAAPGSFGTMFQQGGSIAGGGPSSIAGLAATMIPAGVTEQSVVFGGDSRGGDMTAFASLSLCSQTDSWTARASYTSGLSGKSVGLESAYSGSGDRASVLGSIHALTAASIMQLTDRRTDRLSMWGAIAEGGIAIGSKIPAVVKWSRNLASAILLAEDAREQAEEAAKKVADESSSAATGGPKGQLPDGEDPEKKEPHTTLKEGDIVSEQDALVEAEKFLGKDYSQAEKGRYVSADGKRQFRMLDKDLAGHKGGRGHVHFEHLNPEPGQTPSIHVFFT